MMKTLQKFTIAIALITLVLSCQSKTQVSQVLSKSETRKEIMDSIANNSLMSGEMMEVMMSNKNGDTMMPGNGKMSMLMMKNHDAMMKMMKENPEMMKKMMSEMMETCMNDTSMMNSMCQSMMGNQQMMDMMHKMKGKKMYKTDGMGHKTK